MAGPFTGQESTSQLSSWTGWASVHLLPSSRVTAMLRISFSVRSRNAVTTPSSVTAAAVLQHSHTRVFTIVSPVCFQFESKLAAYSDTTPPSGSFVLFSWSRASSQTRPRPPAGGSNIDTNPCWVFVLSRCGLTLRDQVLPSYLE